MVEEVWCDVVGYEGLYQASNLGRIKSLKRIHEIKINSKKYNRGVNERILSQWLRGDYFQVELWKNRNKEVKSVHRVVFESFNKCDLNGYQIHHKDGNKQNNNINNLEKMTILEHNRHHFKDKSNWRKGIKVGDTNSKYNITIESYKRGWENRYKILKPRNRIIVKLKEQGKTAKELSVLFNVSKTQIYQILKEKNKWLI